jgi:hypothetical protein
MANNVTTGAVVGLLVGATARLVTGNSCTA